MTNERVQSQACLVLPSEEEFDEKQMTKRNSMKSK